MQIQLETTTESKLQDLLEELATRYNMADLTTEDLVNALIDLGYDLIITKEGSMPACRGRFLENCADRIESRSY